MKNTKSPSIALLQGITEQLDIITPFLLKKSKEHSLLKRAVKEGGYLNQNPLFLESPEFIRYIQTSMLLGMSMLGGVTVPAISRFKSTETTASLTWDSGITDTINWGKYDKDFQTFTRYYQDRLSSKPQHQKNLPANILRGIAGFLQSNLLILNAVDDNIQKLFAGKESIANLLKKELNKNLFFILLSCLPFNQINTLFLTIQSYFPEELEVIAPEGKKMKVTSLFGSPTVDPNFLIQKIIIYCDLYFSPEMPIIKEITQSKTAIFFNKLLQNTDNYNEAMTNLKSLKLHQVDIRIQLYSLFHTHLESLDL